MYKDILRTIAGIEVFPILSLLLFVAVFAVVLVWTSRLDASRLSRAARLPLDEDAGGHPPDRQDRETAGAGRPAAPETQGVTL